MNWNKFVRTACNLNIAFFSSQEIDEDSEAEKLSPLLVTDDRSPEKSRSIKTEKSIDENDEVSDFFSVSKYIFQY